MILLPQPKIHNNIWYSLKGLASDMQSAYLHRSVCTSDQIEARVWYKDQIEARV